jgi:hypothetical protein
MNSAAKVRFRPKADIIERGARERLLVKIGVKRALRTNALISLMKVFDVNYVSDEDCRKLAGLHPRDPGGIREAVALLLVPEFLAYSEAARAGLVTALRDAIADENESFKDLFDHIEPAFEFQVDDKRVFMGSLHHAMEIEGVA